MSQFVLTLILNGLVYGMILFLLAAGLSLIFGLMNVVSLAHGSFFMLGGFVGLSVIKLTGSYWLALLLAPLPVMVVGLVIELLFMRRLYERGHLDQVLLTFGFTFVFADVVKTVWGSDIQSLPVPKMLEGAIPLFGGMFPSYRLFLIGVGALLALALWFVIDRTRVGAMVRAGVDDAATAMGIGIDVPILFSSVFSLGVWLAALAGVVAAPILGVYPGIDSEVLIPAFIVIVVGGMGTLRGALAGSLLIGQVDTFGRALYPDLTMFLVYFLMVVMLLARPSGMFGLKNK